MNCTFVENSENIGGAITVSGDKNVVFNCINSTFIGNKATNFGDALTTNGNNTIQVLGSIFINNSAK